MTNPHTCTERRRHLRRAADPTRPPSRLTYLAVAAALGVAIASQAILGLAGMVALCVLVVGGVLVLEHRWHHLHGVPRTRQLPREVARPQQRLVMAVVLAAVVPLTTLMATTAEPSVVAPVTAGVAAAAVLAIGGPLADRRSRQLARSQLSLDAEEPDTSDAVGARNKARAEDASDRAP